MMHSVHQVTQKRVSVSKSTAGNQQEASPRKQGIKNPNPRKFFCEDLRKALQDEIQDNNEVPLLGDFNKCLHEKDCGLTEIVTAFELHDLSHEATNKMKFST